MAKIEQIKIKLGKRSIDLTKEEAVELREVLDELFPGRGLDVAPIILPVIERPYWPRPWTITYGSGTGDSIPGANSNTIYCSRGE